MAASSIIDRICPSGWGLDDVGDQRGKTAIITGANSGIGYYTALHLGLAGAAVVLACRNEKKGLEAIEKLRRAVREAAPYSGGGCGPRSRQQKARRTKRATAASSNGPAGENDTNCSGHFELRVLDVSSIRDVLRFAAAFNNEGRSVDMLINNAGIMMPPYSRTREGFESQAAANYLGHFVLTEKLMPSLQRGVGGGGGAGGRAPPRVVSVSSIIAWRALQYKNIDFTKAPAGEAAAIGAPAAVAGGRGSGGSDSSLIGGGHRAASGSDAGLPSAYASTVLPPRGGRKEKGQPCLAAALNTTNTLLTAGPSEALGTVFGGSGAFRSNSMLLPSFGGKARGYERSEAYAETKLAALLYTREMARRYPADRLCPVAAHPGVASSNLHQHRFGGVMWAMQSPESGALPILRAAVDPLARPGAYYAPRCFGYAGAPCEGIVPPAASDAAYCRRYFDASLAALRPIVAAIEAEKKGTSEVGRSPSEAAQLISKL